MEGNALLRVAAKPLIALGAAMAFGSVQAADNGIYIGAGAADVSTDFDVGLTPDLDRIDDETSGFKLIGGLRPLDPLGVELNYVDLGETEATTTVACATVAPCPQWATFDARALSVSAVGYYSLPFVELFGRVGVARWESDQDVHLLGSQTERGTDMTYGGGAQVRFLSFALRLEYERFELDRESVDSVSLGFTYTFF